MDLGKNSSLYLRDELDPRVLHIGCIEESDGSRLVASFDNICPGLKAQSEITIFYQWRLKFVSRAASLAAVEVNEDCTTLTMDLVGDAVTAENREFYRAPNTAGEVTANFDNEENCVVFDVSSVGFSVRVATEREIGDTAHIVLCHNGRCVAGSVSIRSAEKLEDGFYRYGLRCLKGHDDDKLFYEGVTLINLDLQRQQLARLAGRS